MESVVLTVWFVGVNKDLNLFLVTMQSLESDRDCLKRINFAIYI